MNSNIKKVPNEPKLLSWFLHTIVWELELLSSSAPHNDSLCFSSLRRAVTYKLCIQSIIAKLYFVLNTHKLIFILLFTLSIFLKKIMIRQYLIKIYFLSTMCEYMKGMHVLYYAIINPYPPVQILAKACKAFNYQCLFALCLWLPNIF